MGFRQFQCPLKTHEPILRALTQMWNGACLGPKRWTKDLPGIARTRGIPCFVGVEPALTGRHAFCLEVDQKEVYLRRIVEIFFNFVQCGVEIIKGAANFAIGRYILAGNMDDQLTLAFVMLDPDCHCFSSPLPTGSASATDRASARSNAGSAICGIDVNPGCRSARPGNCCAFLAKMADYASLIRATCCCYSPAL